MTTPIDRRQFFRLRFRGTGKLIAEEQAGRATDAATKYIRPPGAARPDSLFLDSCTRGGACAKACPYGVIQFEGPEGGAAEGSPVLDPGVNACRWCPSFDCISACPSPALTARAEGAPAAIARVEIDQALCLNAQGIVCDDCAAACPSAIHAIRMEGRRPALDTARCTGCGLCAVQCPAEPMAIRVFPL